MTATSIVSEPDRASAVKTQLPNGVRPEMAAGTDAAWLGAHLKVLISEG